MPVAGDGLKHSTLGWRSECSLLCHCCWIKRLNWMAQQSVVVSITPFHTFYHFFSRCQWQEMGSNPQPWDNEVSAPPLPLVKKNLNGWRNIVYWLTSYFFIHFDVVSLLDPVAAAGLELFILGWWGHEVIVLPPLTKKDSNGWQCSASHNLSSYFLPFFSPDASGRKWAQTLNLGIMRWVLHHCHWSKRLKWLAQHCVLVNFTPFHTFWYFLSPGSSGGSWAWTVHLGMMRAWGDYFTTINKKDSNGWQCSTLHNLFSYFLPLVLLVPVAGDGFKPSTLGWWGECSLPLCCRGWPNRFKWHSTV